MSKAVSVRVSTETEKELIEIRRLLISAHELQLAPSALYRLAMLRGAQAVLEELVGGKRPEGLEVATRPRAAGPTLRAKMFLPAEFELTHKLRAYALEAGMSEERIPNELKRFKNYHAANGTMRVRWDAMFKSWCDRFESFRDVDQVDEPEEVAGLFGAKEDTWEL